MSLAVAGLLMGLAGAPHCVAMCGAACGGVVRGQGRARAMWAFQAGRWLGYTTAGAAAGFAVSSVAWLSTQAGVLRPLWMVFHLAVLAWGLTLLVLARQPAFVEAGGRALWTRVRPLVGRRGGLLAAGALWIFMPCGLLWSALLLASLSGGAWQGALTMGLFALGGGLSLAIAPAVLLRLRRAGDRFGSGWGPRLTGLVLAAAATWALWMDLGQRIAAWCAAP